MMKLGLLIVSLVAIGAALLAYVAASLFGPLAWPAAGAAACWGLALLVFGIRPAALSLRDGLWQLWRGRKP